MQREGQGSLAIVLGKEQSLKDITFDQKRACATIVTDRAVFTILGVTNPDGVLVGREGGRNYAAGFVSIASVASELNNGRREIFESDKKAVEDTLRSAYGTASSFAQSASTAIRSYATGLRPSGTPGMTTTPAPHVKPEAPVTKPTPTESPTAAPPKQPAVTPLTIHEKAAITEALARGAVLEQRIAELTKRVAAAQQQTATIEARIAKASSAITAAETRYGELSRKMEPAATPTTLGQPRSDESFAVTERSKKSKPLFRVKNPPLGNEIFNPSESGLPKSS